MKIFDRDGKVNFVDANNVLVGFDNTQDCCEDFGYLFTPELPTDTDAGVVDFDPSGWVFDRAFCEPVNGLGLDKGEAVAFKLTKGEDVMYLTLFNAHNGYYGHGFEMTLGDENLHDGIL
ncbi:MAG TPA: hypothetical protein VNA25_06935 [Phycisphaerae bacterium]|nr:hypothetical protein [Phycisphaerae bacterium]